MPPHKRRKVSAATTQNVSPLPRTQKSIQAFGRISKPQALLDRVTEKKGTASQKVVITRHGLANGATHDQRKRKRGASEEVEVKAEPPSREKDSIHLQEAEQLQDTHPTGPSNFQDGSLDQQPKTPSKVRIPQRPEKETPTKGARGVLDSLTLEAHIPSSCSNSKHLYQSPIKKDVRDVSSDEERIGDLPIALLDLINLHSSFLTALSLHYAHNGVFSPADLRLLTPNIARLWGKRKVLEGDVRRTLGVLGVVTDGGRGKATTGADRGLTLSDYGGGKICIEKLGSGDNQVKMGSPVDEKALNATFCRNLDHLWKNWISRILESPDKTEYDRLDATPPKDIRDASVTEFIAQLPMAPILPCSSLRKISPLLAKGQRRLEEFKAGAIALKKENVPPMRTTTSVGSSKATENRGKSLLERIRAKQLYQSSLPPPLSTFQIDHQAALERLEELIPLLHHLSTSSRSSTTNNGTEHIPISPLPSSITTPEELQAHPQQKRSVFSLALLTLVQHLQNSLRNPISTEQGELAVRVLAEEVAPEWVSVVTVGQVVAVVVRRGETPSMVSVRNVIRAGRDRMLRGQSRK
ncbi:MAG: hypothetical protein M1837_000104 [Sclerophora amabilis]|nr:MAG: hypothetical protein M1837_000104 [Sclerophora amabilis]